MNGKILLLSFAVILAGLFAMPNTLSVFAGQHTFAIADNTSICANCHPDVLNEITSGSYHKSLIGANNECKGCHTIDRIATTLIPRGNNTGNWTAADNYVGLDVVKGVFVLANGTGNNTNISVSGVHVAVTVECVWCHNAVNQTNDAHNIYTSNASSNTDLRGTNEACVGCHTKANVNLKWVRWAGLNITYDFNESKFTAFEPNSNMNTTNTSNQ